MTGLKFSHSKILSCRNMTIDSCNGPGSSQAHEDASRVGGNHRAEHVVSITGTRSYSDTSHCLRYAGPECNYHQSLHDRLHVIEAANVSDE